MENYKEGKRRAVASVSSLVSDKCEGGGGEEEGEMKGDKLFSTSVSGSQLVRGGGRSRQVQLEFGVRLARRRQKRCAEKVARRPGKTKSAVDGEEVEAASSALSAPQTEARGSRRQTANVS